MKYQSLFFSIVCTYHMVSLPVGSADTLTPSPEEIIFSAFIEAEIEKRSEPQKSNLRACFELQHLASQDKPLPQTQLQHANIAHWRMWQEIHELKNKLPLMFASLQHNTLRQNMALTDALKETLRKSDILREAIGIHCGLKDELLMRRLINDLQKCIEYKHSDDIVHELMTLPSQPPQTLFTRAQIAETDQYLSLEDY